MGWRKMGRGTQAVRLRRSCESGFEAHKCVDYGSEDGSVPLEVIWGFSKTGELLRRAEALDAKLGRCDLCPRACGVDRKRAKLGYCGVGSLPKGSLDKFASMGRTPNFRHARLRHDIFSGCTLRCIFCQNYRSASLGLAAK